MADIKYDDIGADTVSSLAKRTENTRTEFKIICERFRNPLVPAGKKERYNYRIIDLQQKFPHILSDLTHLIPAGIQTH